MTSRKLNQIEFMRFAFVVVIVYYQILHSNIMAYVGDQAGYEILASECKYASYIVECFFILGGYFFYYSFWKKPDQSFWEFVYKKIARLWPVLAFSILIGIIFFGYHLWPQLFNLLFLQCIGLSKEYKGINWYISSFFFALLFYFALLKVIKDKKKQNLLIAVLVYFGYVLNIGTTDGGFGRETVYGFINLGLFQAIAGIGWGYLLAASIASIKGLPGIKSFSPDKAQKRLCFIVVSITEASVVFLLMRHFFCESQAYDNQFIVVILFTALLLLMLYGKGLLSRICNRPLFGIWGKYTYAIYVMQQTSFDILKKTLWKNTDFVANNMYLCLAVSVAFSILFGILIYYVVEQPSKKSLTLIGQELFDSNTRDCGCSA